MEKFIDKYLERINYQGSTAANLATLQALQRQHLLHVPFENLDIHMGQSIVLDVEKLFDKVVNRKRGGFCYELNGLFYELLCRLGYQTRRIAASVYDKEKGYGPAYDHLSLLVTLDGIDYLTDVGFGRLAFMPLKLHTDVIQEDEQGVFVIRTTKDDYFRLSKKEKEDWVPQYIFQSHGRAYAEFEPMCHYHQTSPESHFTHKRLISLMKPDGRVTVTANVFKLDRQGVVTEETFGDGRFNDILAQYFDVHL